jgi:hypothetical protein
MRNETRKRRVEEAVKILILLKNQKKKDEILQELFSLKSADNFMHKEIQKFAVTKVKLIISRAKRKASTIIINEERIQAIKYAKINLALRRIVKSWRLYRFKCFIYLLIGRYNLVYYIIDLMITSTSFYHLFIFLSDFKRIHYQQRDVIAEYENYEYRLRYLSIYISMNMKTMITEICIYLSMKLSIELFISIFTLYLKD